METYIDKDYAVCANTICSYFGKEHLKKITIPARIVLIDINTIGDGAYYGSDDINEVVIPGCIQNIGDRCFARCNNLNKVIFEKNPCNLGKAVFEDSALTKLEYPNLTLKKEEYSLLKNNSARIGENIFALSQSPNKLLPNIFKCDMDIYPFAASFPMTLGALFQTQSYKLLPSHREMEKENENSVFLSYLNQVSDELLSLSAEKENDRWVKTEEETLPRKTAVLTFDDSKTTISNDSCTVCAEINLGYFYWQSAKRVMYDNKEYFIYRRHFLTDKCTCEYIRQDVAVYTRKGLVKAEKEAKRVYDKYRMLSYI